MGAKRQMTKVLPLLLFSFLCLTPRPIFFNIPKMQLTIVRSGNFLPVANNEGDLIRGHFQNRVQG